MAPGDEPANSRSAGQRSTDWAGSASVCRTGKVNSWKSWCWKFWDSLLRKKLAKNKTTSQICPEMIQLTSPVKEELFSPLKNKTNSYHQWQALKGRCRKTDTQSNNIFSLDGLLIRHFKPQCSLTNSPDWFPYFKNKWRELEKRSKHFSPGDHFFNSHIFFSWFCIDTGITARANQTTGLTNGRTANWEPEVAFSSFCMLSRRQLTFLFCC